MITAKPPQQAGQEYTILAKDRLPISIRAESVKAALEGCGLDEPADTILLAVLAEKLPAVAAVAKNRHATLLKQRAEGSCCLAPCYFAIIHEFGADVIAESSALGALAARMAGAETALGIARLSIPPEDGGFRR
ncbi:MAG TPA: hypothetical protein VF614_16860 [Chthoniobacteraceae bacterium]|jgi:hypothetical protein